MESKSLIIFCAVVFGSVLIAFTDASPVPNTLVTGADFGKPVNEFPATQVFVRRGRYYGGHPGGYGYGGHPGGYGFGGYPGGFGGSSASAAASASSFGGYGK